MGAIIMGGRHHGGPASWRPGGEARQENLASGGDRHTGDLHRDDLHRDDLASCQSGIMAVWRRGDAASPWEHPAS